MATQVQICNLARGRVGKTIPIASIAEQSAEAMFLSQIWDVGRQFVLRAFEWPFARRRVQLALTTLTASNWNYVYAYPSDCLYAKELVVPGSVFMSPFANVVQIPGYVFNPAAPNGAQRIPFQVDSDPTLGRVLFTNINPAELSYVADVVDPTQFDPIFASALAFWLASECALALQNNPQFGERLRNAYNGEVAAAAARAFSEGTEYQEPDSQFTAARA